MRNNFANNMLVETTIYYSTKKYFYWVLCTAPLMDFGTPIKRKSLDSIKCFKEVQEF